jgi:hypothetical protein
MPTGLLALLDDVALIARSASASLTASLDDIATQSMKAGAKAAGVVIDDAAVTPKYVVGLSPARELPIIWNIAKGSLKNKLLFLLPAALLLGFFAPWAITPLLMAGGLFLCYEGVEKVYAVVLPHAAHAHEAATGGATNAAELEAERTSGAIRTDFILSAEIMALTLANVSESPFITQLAVLAAVGIAITLVVYGVVGLLVKMDDIGLAMTRTNSGLLKSVGRGLVRGMPWVLKLISVIGTAAMLWVGGSILIHGAAQLGWHWPEETIHNFTEITLLSLSTDEAVVGWSLTTLQQAVVAMVAGTLAIPLVGYVIGPVIKALKVRFFSA